MNRWQFLAVIVSGYLFLPAPMSAQIAPDGTLPVNSVVTPNGNTNIITGGTTRLRNLFHSFREFSVLTGSTAFFNNSLTIENILVRVTGGNTSNIDGILKANGTANLFLLNPNGIIFGKNARLDLGGSFLGTTADSVKFADGTEFSAKTPQAPPLLTVEVPVGLQLGSNSGEIRVQGDGHHLIGLGILPIFRDPRDIGIQVRAGKTLALVGGEVTFDGGIVSAPGGRIEIGSVGNGRVSFTPTTSGWNFNYEGVSAFKDMQLSERSLIDASGLGGSSIQVQGRQISLRDGSVILMQNQGLVPDGTFAVNASDSLTISGTDPIARIPGGLGSETVGGGDAADLVISTPNLKLFDGGTISNRTYGTGNAGDVTLNVPESLQVVGTSPRDFRALSSITSLTLGFGNAGDVAVSTKNLTVTGGGFLTSATAGSGAGGNVTIFATEAIEIFGVEPNSLAPSIIGATALGTGNAGDLTINTSRLVLRDGGRIDSSTASAGNSGSVRINASRSVEVRGTVPGSINPSLIISSGNIVDESLQQLYHLPPVPSGNSGNVTINTPRLVVTNGGQIAVKNDGTGDAGTLSLDAPSILVSNSGGITAATTVGNGGNLTIGTQDLRLQNGSITATAGGNGNGGNIEIDADTLVMLENSSIAANAFEGNGGRIAIDTQGLFQSPESFITASSSRGINGVVEITILGFDPKNSLTPLSTNLLTPEQLIAGSCFTRRNARSGSFYITGTGGLPISPDSGIAEWESLAGVRSVPPGEERGEGRSQFSLPANRTEETASAFPSWKRGDPIVEAQGLVVTPDGRTLLAVNPQGFRPKSGEALLCPQEKP